MQRIIGRPIGCPFCFLALFRKESVPVLQPLTFFQFGVIILTTAVIKRVGVRLFRESAAGESRQLSSKHLWLLSRSPEITVGSSVFLR